MAEALVNVTEGSGKKLHGWDYSVGGNTVIEEFVLPGQYPYASYTVMVGSTSIATANDHVVQLMAGSSLNVYIRSITIEQNVNATTATKAVFQLLRLTSAGTGGTAVTPSKMDTGDAASGATAMTLPTAKGTESTVMRETVVIMRQAISATQTQPEESVIWTPGLNFKAWRIAAGTANGIAIKSLTAIAGCTVDVMIDLVELNY